jgi:hypothetical protein
MSSARCDIDRVAGTDAPLVAVKGYDSGTSDDIPVLCSEAVALIAETLTCGDADALDPEPVSLVDDVVTPPRAVVMLD